MLDLVFKTSGIYIFIIYYTPFQSHFHFTSISPCNKIISLQLSLPYIYIYTLIYSITWSSLTLLHKKKSKQEKGKKTTLTQHLQKQLWQHLFFPTILYATDTCNNFRRNWMPWKWKQETEKYNFIFFIKYKI